MKPIHHDARQFSSLRRLWIVLWLLLCTLLLAGCPPGRAETRNGAVQGRILLWHSLAAGEASTLSEIIARFRTIHPRAAIQIQGFATAQEMRDAFQAAADSGLGPDLLLAPSAWVGPLADQRLIDPIDSAIPESTLQRYTPTVLETVRYREQLYGLPASINTMGLYFRTRLVEQPAATLDELLAEAAQGRVVAIGASFLDAFWGAPAFGGRLLDDEGRVVLDRGGFANWLAWLRDAREAPGMIIDNNREVLRSRFMDDGVAYYVGYADELNLLVDTLGSDQIGVAPLPAGPVAAAGPFLTTHSFLFSNVSSEAQRNLALALAQFVTNTEQSSTLMRQARHVPANTRVRVNPRLNPNIASFSAQARTAVPLANRPEMEAILAYGGDAYNRVLEGVLEPAEAAIEITNLVNEINGFAPVTTPPSVCTGVGTVQLAHSLEGSAVEALDAIINRFRSECPTIIVRSQYIAPSDLPAQVAARGAGAGRIDLIFASQSAFQAFSAESVVANLNNYVDNETLQRFRPDALNALRNQGGLYGLPVSVGAPALYYNRALIADPARTLDELRAQAGQGTPVALDIRFEAAFWGVGAFDDGPANATGDQLVDPNALAAWLEWLREARERGGIRLSRDPGALQADFVAGNTAYLVAGPSLLAELETTLGAQLGIVPLPAGPAGDAAPLLTASGFFVHRQASERQARLAMEFATYATNVDSQTLWMQATDLIPANTSVEVADTPSRIVFVEQARTARVMPNDPAMRTLLAVGDVAYHAVLDEGVEPETAVQRMFAALQAATEGNGPDDDG